MRNSVVSAVAAVTAASVVALPALAATKTIAVGDDFFVKPGGATVTVAKGTTVTWRFTGKRKHTVVGTGSARFIDSGKPQRRGTYALKMTKTGTFKIICSVHGSKQRMTLKVK